MSDCCTGLDERKAASSTHKLIIRVVNMVGESNDGIALFILEVALLLFWLFEIMK